MLVQQSLEGWPPNASVGGWRGGPTCFTIGMFDGLHRGHRAVLDVLRQEAQARSAAAAVLTFSNHPLSVLDAGQPPLLLLTGSQHKLRLLERYGAAIVLMLLFDKRLAATSAGELLVRLADAYGCVCIVVGDGARVGRGGVSGDALRAAAGGMSVRFVPRVTLDGQPISSSAVREAVYAADFVRAARLLGRRFGTFGKVLAGKGRGRQMGFRTVNIDCQRETRPPYGVYAGWLLIEGRRAMPAVANVGVRPTFASGGERDFLIEAHAPAAELPELYGCEVEFVYATKVRDERFFASPDALARQIAADVSHALELLRSETPPCAGDYAVAFSS